jgi:hypothetical protein
MTNLIIGLLVGLASAIALAVMWRVAERLRKDMEARDPAVEDGSVPGEASEGEDLGVR